MKITNENAVTVKNIYFFVTVFCVEFFLMFLLGGIFLVFMYFFRDVISEGVFFLVGLIIFTFTWYIAFKLGVYNIFHSKKIAKKNIKKLKECLKKDLILLSFISVLVLSNSDILIMLGLSSLFINYPLLTRMFDKTARNYYKTI